MLSVLVPLYNFNASALIRALHQQLCKTNIVFEILCIEDGSTCFTQENKQASSELRDVKYEILPSSLGRQNIRRYMAQKAQYDLLLFSDCDNQIIKKNFIQNYLANASYKVVYGGRTYQCIKHLQKEHILHFTYGNKRESLNKVERNKDPYRHFLSTNFLIKKSIFLSIPQNNSILGYGYEDSYMAHYLKEKNIPIKHINNPLCHLGVESSDTFIEKTKNALQNLSKMYLSNAIESKQIKLLRAYQRTKRFKLTFLLSLLNRFENSMLNHLLKSTKPSLFVFDLFRLSYFHKTLCSTGQ